MRGMIVLWTAVGCLYTLVSGVVAQEQSVTPRVLFVYDTLDDKSSFFITTFRDELQALPCRVDEAAVEHSAVGDISPYSLLVVYSRIMAFDMKSPVRKWIKKMKSYNATRVALFVTANRWFLEKHFNRVQAMLQSRDADIVDAVSMATKDMTDKEKRAKVRTFLEDVVK